MKLKKYRFMVTLNAVDAVVKIKFSNKYLY